jgi:hypothetical protein
MEDDPLRFEEAHDPKGAVYFQVECLADVSIAAATIWLGGRFRRPGLKALDQPRY